MSDPILDSTTHPREKPVLLQPDNHGKNYEALFVQIDTGEIKLPMFQREFVWEKERSTKLIDSILKVPFLAYNHVGDQVRLLVFLIFLQILLGKK
ncbi:MAG TPA: hypothetical protein VK582_11180 [Pyrinomonadaceae bacterium]|nr:hypothetical protein [Pyrinomonadaceae bacterium]